jgi:hypothetical protein
MDNTYEKGRARSIPACVDEMLVYFILFLGNRNRLSLTLLVGHQYNNIMTKQDRWWHATINLDPYTAFISTFTTEHNLAIDDYSFLDDQQGSGGAQDYNSFDLSAHQQGSKEQEL